MEPLAYKNPTNSGPFIVSPYNNKSGVKCVSPLLKFAGAF